MPKDQPNLMPGVEGVGPDIYSNAIPTDEREWVPARNFPGDNLNIWIRPLMFNTVTGAGANILRIRGSGVISRHLHTGPVQGFVIKGSWRYLEHDWVASAGDYIYEPAGEVHTLVVDEGVEEMMTFFVSIGTVMFVDDAGETIGYEDIFKRKAMCRAHYREVGLDESYLDRITR